MKYVHLFFGKYLSFHKHFALHKLMHLMTVFFFSNSGFTCKVATIFFNAVALSLYRNLPQENSDVLATVVKNPRVKKNEREESTLCKNYTIVNLSMGYYWILIKFKII